MISLYGSIERSPILFDFGQWMTRRSCDHKRIAQQQFSLEGLVMNREYQKADVD